MHYELLDELASGGMAVVHLGRIPTPSGATRCLAFKRLHASVANDPELLAMFREEARLGMAVRDKHVVAALDVIDNVPRPLLVMEYVHGERLAKLLRVQRAQHRPVPVNVVVGIALGMLQGLEAIHRAKSSEGLALHIVHGQINPDNLLIDQRGVVKIIDFGQARANDSAEFARARSLTGRPDYQAPEQIERAVFDQRADLYAVSVVMWELLTGSKLFDVMRARSQVEPVFARMIPPMSMLAPRVPKLLEQIVLCGLRNDPAERYASAAEMRAELQTLGQAVDEAQIATWMLSVAGAALSAREKILQNPAAMPAVFASKPAKRIVTRKICAASASAASDNALPPLAAVSLEASVTPSSKTPCPIVRSTSATQRRRLIGVAAALILAATAAAATTRVGQPPAVVKSAAVPSASPGARAEARAATVVVPITQKVVNQTPATARSVARPRSTQPALAARKAVQKATLSRTRRVLKVDDGF